MAKEQRPTLYAARDGTRFALYTQDESGTSYIVGHADTRGQAQRFASRRNQRLVFVGK